MITGMNLSAGSKIVKYLMFIFNLLFVITGIVLITFGFVIYKDFNIYKYILEAKFFSVPILLIVVGFTIFFIAFFGCCGAVRENRFMILTFTTLMALIFVLELVAGILGYVLKVDATDIVRQNMNETMHQYQNQTKITYIWDTIQENFECCGITNSTDWAEIIDKKKNLPRSCCRSEIPSSENCTTSNSFKQGCLPLFVDFVSSRAMELGIVCLTIAFVQVIGIFFSAHLARSIHRNKYETV